MMTTVLSLLFGGRRMKEIRASCYDGHSDLGQDIDIL